MKPVHSFVVSAKLPSNIEKLKELAYNFWWCWNSEARELFHRIDRDIWEEVNHNPVLLINKVPQEKLLELSEKPDFIRFVDYVFNQFLDYMDSQSWYDSKPERTEGGIAYFSPEFGINESFPNYSGGLGILAGDHLKSSSDLGLPLVGVGLLYQQGYFRQHLTQNGWQNELYLYNDFFSLPLYLMKDDDGNPILIDVDMPLGKAFAQVWKMYVGKVKLYLLDTNIDQNQIGEYRVISNQLYGGTRDTRIQQEIMLGIGGMRALRAVGIEPEVVHINEGHAAFALLERTRHFMEKYKMNFHEAKQITIASSVFTTHTPVPAGNEVFKVDRLENYFTNYARMLGLKREQFLELGQIGIIDYNSGFSMTVLGIKMTAYQNGVSKLHGVVARDMWKDIWKGYPVNDVPIDHITNGIHTHTWIAREFEELFDRYLSPEWKINIDNQEIWDNVSSIPSEELWREKQRRRIRLVLFARKYLKSKQKGFLPPDQVRQIDEYLDPDALTIGFARRFATYKRATLLFRNMERVEKLCKNPDMPVQIVIAGKAHPHDTAGKETIQYIIQKVREHGLEKYVVFLEDYDMVIGRLLVKGCDVWLNTPIRPMEASGTSGMKAGLNGTLNLSILDGWWDEGFNGLNGFSIGEGEEYENQYEQEIVESEELYDLLEQVVVKMFYDRSSGRRFPDKWVNYMKESIRTVAPEFSSSRMVRDYSNKFYFNAMRRYHELIEDNGQNARSLEHWKIRILMEWSKLSIIEVNLNSNHEAYVGKPIDVIAKVNLGNLKPEEVVVQVVYGSVDHQGNLANVRKKKLELVGNEGKDFIYQGKYLCPDTGMQGATVRVLPHNPLMGDPSEIYICRWANQP